MTLYLCTVGTSASQAILQDELFQQKYLPAASKQGRLDGALVQRLGWVAAALRAMEPYFLALDYRQEEDLRRRLSAEIHSLVRLKIQTQDEVILLASDTNDGEVCAGLVRSYLVQRLKLAPDQVQVEKVEGLQVDDSRVFHRVGVPRYFRKVLAAGDRCGWLQMILNPTGGYKALVPYTTLLGMMFGVPVCYIFDNGKELLQLPPLPVDVDHTRLSTLLPVMTRIAAETAIPEGEFWGTTPYDLRQLYEVLLQPEGQGLVTLSEVGLLVYERLLRVQAEQRLALYLSRQAWEDLWAAPPEWNAPGFLARLQRVNDIDRYRHFLSDGTLWLKPGNTPDRYRVFLEGTRLLIFRIVKHDEYEKMVARPWPRSQYAPFTRFDQIE